ncbi:hypothetical protein [Psychrobacter jeotgali]|uniref:hypothetical protein n=1 Tax=Psychrobacter jeotgali TaxID=179010 RepID=UPI00191B62F6|nr:hypothetical protein [Psychrobacter jeotgali]
MAKRKVRVMNKTTLLIMGEGEHDKAFLKHMRGVYYNRSSGVKITLDFSSGGSPHDIIKDTVKKSKHTDYDKRFILMDEDIAIKQQDYDIAHKESIVILQSAPVCLEGMLLTILGEYTASISTAQKCKSLLHPKLSGNPIEPKSYYPLFEKQVLDDTNHTTIQELRKLLGG